MFLSESRTQSSRFHLGCTGGCHAKARCPCLVRLERIRGSWCCWLLPRYRFNQSWSEPFVPSATNVDVCCSCAHPFFRAVCRTQHAPSSVVERSHCVSMLPTLHHGTCRSTCLFSTSHAPISNTHVHLHLSASRVVAFVSHMFTSSSKHFAPFHSWWRLLVPRPSWACTWHA